LHLVGLNKSFHIKDARSHEHQISLPYICDAHKQGNKYDTAGVLLLCVVCLSIGAFRTNCLTAGAPNAIPPLTAFIC